MQNYILNKTNSKSSADPLIRSPFDSLEKRGEISLRAVAIALTISTLLVACSTSSTRSSIGSTDSLAGLQSMYNPRGAQVRSMPSTGKIREMALRETALSLGAQSGLAWRAKIIDEELTQKARELDTVYDFNALTLQHNVLPPVLLEGRNTLNQANSQTIRLSDRVYKIAKQAHFITTPPTWRQYLWMDYVQPEAPNTTLLPKSREERQIWNSCVAKGWENGVSQANTILEENLARLKEDFSGMILYRKLLAMNIVSAPYVSDTSLGITGDGSEIHVDDRVLRITALPTLNINSEQWRAALAKDENALEKFRHMDKLAQKSSIKITNKAWQPIITPVN